MNKVVSVFFHIADVHTNISRRSSKKVLRNAEHFKKTSPASDNQETILAKQNIASSRTIPRRLLGANVLGREQKNYFGEEERSCFSP